MENSFSNAQLAKFGQAGWDSYGTDIVFRPIEKDGRKIGTQRIVVNVKYLSADDPKNYDGKGKYDKVYKYEVEDILDQAIVYEKKSKKLSELINAAEIHSQDEPFLQELKLLADKVK